MVFGFGFCLTGANLRQKSEIDNFFILKKTPILIMMTVFLKKFYNFVKTEYYP